MRRKGTAAWVHGPARSSDQGQGKPSAEGRGRGEGGGAKSGGPCFPLGVLGKTRVNKCRLAPGGWHRSLRATRGPNLGRLFRWSGIRSSGLRLWVRGGGIPNGSGWRGLLRRWLGLGLGLRGWGRGLVCLHGGGRGFLLRNWSGLLRNWSGLLRSWRRLLGCGGRLLCSWCGFFDGWRGLLCSWGGLWRGGLLSRLLLGGLFRVHGGGSGGRLLRCGGGLRGGRRLGLGL